MVSVGIPPAAVSRDGRPEREGTGRAPVQAGARARRLHQGARCRENRFLRSAVPAGSGTLRNTHRDFPSRARGRFGEGRIRTGSIRLHPSSRASTSPAGAVAATCFARFSTRTAGAFRPGPLPCSPTRAAPWPSGRFAKRSPSSGASRDVGMPVSYQPRRELASEPGPSGPASASIGTLPVAGLVLFSRRRRPRPYLEHGPPL